ncbi:MAG TPA: hypothetical protein VJB14_00745, partial [Planctomycetota bacterium]|nr:hypothetical protein [Planctomycetota bacterium]
MRLLPAALLVLLGAAPAQEDSLTERLLDAVERRHRATPDPTDVCEVVVRLKFDRARILAFMSGLSWDPYPGILRDVGGTLMCGGGNSIDRALLLQSLLEVAGEKTRLVRVDLAEADGLKLVEAFRKRERKDRPEVDPKLIAADLGVEAPAVEAMVNERRRAESALVDEILEAAKGEAARLAPLVGPIAGRVTEVPREHVWVQVQEKAGWVDLDPSPVEIPRK